MYGVGAYVLDSTAQQPTHTQPVEPPAYTSSLTSGVLYECKGSGLLSPRVVLKRCPITHEHKAAHTPHTSTDDADTS